jgi:hypothetical protein
VKRASVDYRGLQDKEAKMASRVKQELMAYRVRLVHLERREQRVKTVSKV